MENDQKWMRLALNLAHRGLGTTYPNPSVGCVIVKDDILISTGHTSLGGRPHAETIALEKAGSNSQGATAYISFEPCSHHGKTPPCAEALINAGIKRAVIATGDPDPRVSGKGIKLLKEAGIEVTFGILKNEAEELNKGFILKVTEERPLVTLKLAVSKNHKITPGDSSQWLTGELARDYAHYLRATHDAILVGIGTVFEDDPLLNCRLPGLDDRSPIRIILDSNLRIPENSKLIVSRKKYPLWVVTEKERTSISDITLIPKQKNIRDTLREFTSRGITRLLVEGGSKVASSFLNERLVDEMILITSPKIIGDKGLSAPETPNYFKQISKRRLGEDISIKFADKFLYQQVFS